jgi:hypothetical protein
MGNEQDELNSLRVQDEVQKQPISVQGQSGGQSLQTYGGQSGSLTQRQNPNNANGYYVQPQSDFRGGAIAYFFWRLVAGIITTITLGLGFPAAKCMLIRWGMDKSIIDGRRLRFDGTGWQLFGRFILWLLLSVITLGIYTVIFLPLSYKKWEIKHTHFEGEQSEECQSYFDGSVWGYFGVRIIAFIVTILTLFLGSFWAKCYKERWEARHTYIDGKQFLFDGTGWQYFGKCILWLFLTIITFLIYSFWLVVKSRKWLNSHTHIEPECLGELTPEQIEDRKYQEYKKGCNSCYMRGLVTTILPGIAIVIFVLIVISRNLIKSSITDVYTSVDYLSILYMLFKVIFLIISIVIIIQNNKTAKMCSFRMGKGERCDYNKKADKGFNLSIVGLILHILLI